MLELFLERTLAKERESSFLINNTVLALFTKVKTWKQPECPSIDKHRKKIWRINTVNVPHHKNNEIM